MDSEDDNSDLEYDNLDSEDDDSDGDNKMQTFRKTNLKDWILMKEGIRKKLPVIEPLPYRPREGKGKNFDVNITEEELASLIDKNGDLGFEPIIEWGHSQPLTV